MAVRGQAGESEDENAENEKVTYVLHPNCVVEEVGMKQPRPSRR